MEGFTIEQLIELSGENAPRLYRQPLASGDSGAHTWEVRIVRGGAAVDLTGCTATLNVRRDGDSDEATLRKRATIAGNRVSCELPRGVYELGGKLTAVMVVEDSAGHVVTAAVLLLRGKQYITDHIADPDGTLPSVPELLQRVAAMEGTVSQLKDDIGFKTDLLWTNAAPSANFPEQSISIDLSGYKYIYIVFRISTDTPAYKSMIAEVDNRNYITGSYGNTIIQRTFYTGLNTIRFLVSEYGSGNSDRFHIPYKVYGVR